jgi:hypothetical protein
MFQSNPPCGRFFFPLELQMKIFNPIIQISFLDEIVGATSLNSILMPLV